MGARVLSQTSAWRRLSIVALLLLVSAALIAFLVLTSATSTTTTFASSHTEFKAVETDRDTLCAIKKSDGTIECWGWIYIDLSDPQQPTDGGYETVEVGPVWNCAIKTDGTAKCWGSNTAQAPDNVGRNNDTGKYHDISLSSYHACWIVRDDTTAANDGMLECEVFNNWAGAYGVGSVPSEIADYKFQSVTSYTWHTCALVLDSDRDTSGNQDEGLVKCWDRYSAPPNITYKSIAAGVNHNCGVVKDGDTTNVITGDDEDTINCWERQFDGKSDPSLDGKSDPPPDVTFKSVAAGRYHSCGVVKDSDTVQCWGNSWDGRTGAPIGTYHALTAYEEYTCAITIDSDPSTTGNQNSGALACWGDLTEINKTGASFNPLKNDSNVPSPNVPTPTWTPTPPRDVIDSISVGMQTTCLLTDAGDVHCSGRNALGEGAPPNMTRADFVSVGYGHSCGISHYGKDIYTDTNIVCWGDNTYGQSIPPSGAFTRVSAGRRSTCGLKTDGSVVCWGINEPPNYDLISGVPSSGVFVDVKVGFYSTDSYEHACALSNTGTVSCWGNNTQGQTAVPSGISFKAIAVGGRVSCGIVQDSNTSNQTADENVDTVRCWGEGEEYKYGNPIDKHFHSIKDFPSSITFKEITTQHSATCGILKEDYQDLRTAPLYSVYDRKTDTPYCQGLRTVYALDNDGQHNSRQYLQYFDESGKTYSGLASGLQHTCAIRSDGIAECEGQEFLGHPIVRDVAPIAAGTAQDFSCNGVDYKGASPIEGGRFTATGGDFYVSIPAGALADNTIIGVRMTKGNSAEGSIGSGHEFKGNVYSVTVENSDCTYPGTTITTDRRVDVCIPKPSSRSGRWWDWQMFKIESNSPTGNSLQGFTDLDGLVCAEVKELPITVAAASKMIPTPIPTPTATATPVSLNDNTNDPPSTAPGRPVKPGDLIIETPVADVFAYIRVSADALTQYPTRYLDISHGLMKDEKPVPTTAESGTLLVGDQYVGIDLLYGNRVPIASIDPRAEICLTAPGDNPVDAVLYHLGDDATTWDQLTPVPIKDLPEKYRTGFACGFASQLSKFVGASILATPTPIGGQLITRIEPNVTRITLSPEDRVRLSVDIYGVQDVLDNSLADDVTFEWSVEPSGGLFEEADYSADDDVSVDEHEALFTTPSQAGQYTVKAWLDRYECRDDDNDDGCTAEFEVTVRRAAATPEPTVAPMNPAGEIPIFITDSDSNLYQVFTPEEGGNFEGDDVTVVADPGAVPNHEVIGVRAEVGDEASNVGQTKDRVTLAGSYYGIHAVDDAGRPLNGYLLDDPVTVCMPVPPSLSTNISQLAMVSERADGTFAILSSNVRLSSESGVLICGALSELSARLAVGHLESPSALPTATPTPQVEEPDTGGNTPPISTSALMLLIILGTAITAMSVALFSRNKTS